MISSDAPACARSSLPRLSIPAQPSGPSLEERLLSAISRVLAIPRDEIPLDDSFTDLGGNQTTANALQETCNLSGLDLKTADILRCRTLAELETCARPLRPDVPFEEHVGSSSPSKRRRLSSTSPGMTQFSPASYPRHTSLDSDVSSPSRTSNGSSLRRVKSLRQQQLEMETDILAHPAVSNAAVIRPRAGYFEGASVVLLTLKAFPSALPSEPSRREVRMLRKEHMSFASAQVGLIRQSVATDGVEMPAAWVVIESMPVASSGKMDRRRLQTWVQNLNESMYERVLAADSAEVVSQPSNEIERKIQQRISRVLNIPEERVGMNFSWSQLGGDSITASRLVEECRTESILLRQNDILKSSDVSEIAFIAHSRDTSIPKWIEQDPTDTFELSPMQQLYFQTAIGGSAESRARTDGSYRFNQSLLFRINTPVKLDDVRAAVEAIVGHHHMLRARFSHGPGGWRQRILDDTEDSYRFGHHSVSRNREVERIVERSQSIIDIEAGPVFAAEHFFTDDGQQMLYIIAHHLVVDLLSWRTIVRDLDELLTKGCLYSQRSMPFQSWIAETKQEVDGLDHSSLLPFDVPPGDYRFWGLEHAANTYSDAAEVGFTLSADLTSILQTACNAVLGTDTVEIYLAALMLSFSQTFHDRPVPTIWNQEPGRDPTTSFPTSISRAADIEETVGWFTTLCPIASVIEGADDLIAVLRRVKDMRRAIPQRGWGYFASRVRDRTMGRFALTWPFEIMFTYAGSTSQFEPGKENAILEHLPLPGKTLASRTSDIGPAVGRIALFEISAMIDRGAAKVKFLYNRHAHHQERITQWIRNYEFLLLEAIGRLRYHREELTLCDINLGINYAELSRLNQVAVQDLGLGLESVREIEDVFPVTAVQQDVLVRQQVLPDSGFVSATYELASCAAVDVPSPLLNLPLPAKEVDVSRICSAWQALISQHQALRTVFIDSVTDLALYDAVVLKHCGANMLFLDAKSPELAVPMLEKLPPIKNKASEPRHRLTVCRIPGGKAMVKLDVSAAICDASSVKHLFASLIRFYTSPSPSPSFQQSNFTYPTYLSALAYARSLPVLGPVRSLLSSVSPCIFPTLSSHPSETLSHASLPISLSLDRIGTCASYRAVAPETLLRLAWALTLRSFTGQDNIVFGYRASGRGLDQVPGLDRAVGSFDSFLVCALDLPGHKTLDAALKQVHDSHLHLNGGRFLGLGEVVHSARPSDRRGRWGEDSRLFNTILLFENEDVSKRRPCRSPSNLHSVSSRQVQIREMLDADLVAKVKFKGGDATLELSHRILAFDQAQQVANTFSAAINTVVGENGEGPQGSVEGAELFTDFDLETILSWYQRSRIAEAGVVHELVTEQARRVDGEKTAVEGWNGQMSYWQMEDYSNVLARELHARGAKTGMPIPTVFEKSIWGVVGALGVMKSGAAFVPFDGDEPISVSRILQILGATIMVVSESFASKLKDMPHIHVVVVSEKRLQRLVASPSISTSNVLEPSMTVTHIATAMKTNVDLRDIELPESKLSDPACILISGSSPRESKGLVFSHSALSSALLSQGASLGIDEKSKVMQLSAFGVDIAVCEIFATLIHGGTVCVPSAAERLKDFSGAVNRFKASWSYMTPLLSRKLIPESLPSLETIVFRTRALDECTLRPWREAGKKVLLAYGTPEICPLGITALEIDSPKKLGLVGKPSVGRFWIVGKDDCRRLAPVGAVGELVLEGPTLSTRFDSGDSRLHHKHSRTLSNLRGLRGTATPGSSLSTHPSGTTMSTVHGQTSGLTADATPKMRYFRTGHRARFLEGGSVELLDSKDEAIISEKTVPLGEVESAIRKCLGRGFEVVVEAFTFTQNAADIEDTRSGAAQTLGVFIEFGSQFHDHGDGSLKQLSPDTRSRLALIKELVTKSLPAYLVPELFIPIKHIPVTPSLKPNRRKLQRLIGSMTKSELMNLCQVDPSGTSGPWFPLKPLPLTACEQQVRSLWARVLKSDEDSIGPLDTFLRLGGDIILAVEVAIAAKRDGLTLPLSDLLGDKTLSDLARTIAPTATPTSPSPELSVDQACEKLDPPAFPPPSRQLATPEFISTVLAPAVGVSSTGEIKDCAPATCNQIKAIESAMLSPHPNISWLSLSLSGPVSADRLKEACSLLCTIHPILRTAFVVKGRSVWQVVLRSWSAGWKMLKVRAGWRLGGVVEKILKRDSERMTKDYLDFTSPMTRFVFVDGGKSSVLLMRFSRAQLDDASLPVLMNDLRALYQGTSNPPKRSVFTDYVKSCISATETGESREYFRQLLEESKMTDMVLKKGPALPGPTSVLKQKISVGSLAALGIGFETVVLSAWAIALATLAGSADVVFGLTVPARSVPGRWDGLVGSSVNNIPVRVQFGEEKMAALDLLRLVQKQRAASEPHEAMGWLNILETSTRWAYWTNFGSVVSVSTIPSVMAGDSMDFTIDNATATKGRLNLLPGSEWYSTDLFIRASLRGSSASIEVVYPDHRIPRSLAEEALASLCSVIARLSFGAVMERVVPGRGELEGLEPRIPVLYTPGSEESNVSVKSATPSPASLFTSTAPTQGVERSITTLATLATSIASAPAAASTARMAPPPIPAPIRLPPTPTIINPSPGSPASKEPALPLTPSKVPLPPSPTPSGQLGNTLPSETKLSLQALISDVWASVLDPRCFGVPEKRLHTAAFYDLWGSLLPAAAIAQLLTAELAIKELPIPAVKEDLRSSKTVPTKFIKLAKSHMIITMEDIISHPSMLAQLDLLTAKVMPVIEEEWKVKRKTSFARLHLGHRRDSSGSFGRSMRGMGPYLTVITDTGNGSKSLRRTRSMEKLTSPENTGGSVKDNKSLLSANSECRQESNTGKVAGRRQRSVSATTTPPQLDHINPKKLSLFPPSSFSTSQSRTNHIISPTPAPLLAIPVLSQPATEPQSPAKSDSATTPEIHELPSPAKKPFKLVVSRRPVIQDPKPLKSATSGVIASGTSPLTPYGQPDTLSPYIRSPLSPLRQAPSIDSMGSLTTGSSAAESETETAVGALGSRGGISPLTPDGMLRELQQEREGRGVSPLTPSAMLPLLPRDPFGGGIEQKEVVGGGLCPH